MRPKSWAYGIIPKFCATSVEELVEAMLATRVGAQVAQQIIRTGRPAFLFQIDGAVGADGGGRVSVRWWWGRWPPCSSCSSSPSPRACTPCKVQCAPQCHHWEFPASQPGPAPQSQAKIQSFISGLFSTVCIDRLCQWESMMVTPSPGLKHQCTMEKSQQI